MTNIKQAKKHLATIADYKKTFSSDHGKRVLWDLMRNAHFINPLVGKNEQGQICPYETYIHEGERNIVLYILDKLKFNERVLLDMIDEHHKKERKYDDTTGDDVW